MKLSSTCSAPPFKRPHKSNIVKRVMHFLAIFLFFNTPTFSQNCSCANHLEFINAFIQKNYIGFEHKTNTVVNKKFLSTLYDSLRKSAETVFDISCIKILQTFAHHFKDRHLAVSLNEDLVKLDQLIESYKLEEKTTLSEAEILAAINSKKNLQESIVGKWEDDSQLYQIAIFPETGKENVFLGVYLKGDSIFSFPKQIKLRIKKLSAKKYILLDYFDTYHVRFTPQLELQNNVLNVRGFGNWYKTSSNLSKNAASIKNQEPFFKSFSKNTILLSLPSFNIKYKNKIDSLLLKAHTIIRNTKYLIIDLRGNSGGSNYSFDSILPLIYTNPIPLFGAKMLASDSTINYYTRRLNKPTTPGHIKVQLQNDIDVMKKNRNKMIELWKDDTLLRNEIYKLPRKIAIIIDRNTASSAEHFLLRAKYSSKVIIFGESSAGAADFGDANEIAIPCSDFLLGYPTTMGNHISILPIDNTGIIPDFKIPLSVKDWISYTRLTLEKK